MSATGQPKSAEPTQEEALECIRVFMRSKNVYDCLPYSFRIIGLDTSLQVKKALMILISNQIVSAPLWNSNNSKFAGLLVSQDFINVIEYYYQTSSFPEAIDQIEALKLSDLCPLEEKINAKTPECKSVHPMTSLFEACLRLVDSRAQRVALIDHDDDSGREMVIAVLTQFRMLRFIALNSKETNHLRTPISELPLGTFDNLTTADLDTPVIDVIHEFFHKGISAVPIIDKENTLINIYEAVDVIYLIRSGTYQDLDLSVGEAISKRPETMSGVTVCKEEDTLDDIFDTIRKNRIHRIIVVDDQCKLRGIISFSDILRYLLGPCST